MKNKINSYAPKNKKGKGKATKKVNKKVSKKAYKGQGK